MNKGCFSSRALKFGRISQLPVIDNFLSAVENMTCHTITIVGGVEHHCCSNFAELFVTFHRQRRGKCPTFASFRRCYSNFIKVLNIKILK